MAHKIYLDRYAYYVYVISESEAIEALKTLENQYERMIERVCKQLDLLDKFESCCKPDNDKEAIKKNEELDEDEFIDECEELAKRYYNLTGEVIDCDQDIDKIRNILSEQLDLVEWSLERVRSADSIIELLNRALIREISCTDSTYYLIIDYGKLYTDLFWYEGFWEDIFSL